MKKKAVAFTIASDPQNKAYAEKLANSLRKFHTSEELPLLIYDLSKEQKHDPMVHYRATPKIARELLKEYDLVLKLDADQIITGDLSHILDRTDYDFGTVLNWNRIDPQLYGLVATATIDPSLYFNCGLVAMRNKDAVEHWWKLCHSVHFDRSQYKEQDILNFICHYGPYKVQCFDWMNTWNGLVSKGEWPRVRMEGDRLVIDPLEIEPGKFFPEAPKTVKVLHWAGGNSGDKMNYRIGFQEPVIERLDYLVSPTQNEKAK